MSGGFSGPEPLPCTRIYEISETARRLFAFIKGKDSILLQGDLAQRFTLIYNKHVWQDEDSRSGADSNLNATENIRNVIPASR
jgi:hypothetical protein